MNYLKMRNTIEIAILKRLAKTQETTPNQIKLLNKDSAFKNKTGEWEYMKEYDGSILFEHNGIQYIAFITVMDFDSETEGRFATCDLFDVMVAE